MNAIALLILLAQDVDLAPGADLAQALSRVGPGGTITLAAGRYAPGQTMITTARLTVRSKPGGRAVLDFGGRGGFYLKGDGIVLRDLDILNAQNFGVDVDGSDCVLEGCRVLGSGGDAVKLSPGNWQQKKYNRGTRIERCEIGENKAFEGIDCVGQDDVRIVDSYFHDTPGWGVYLKGGAARGVIERCLFVRCGTMPSNPAGGVCLGEHTGPDEVMTNKHGKAWESVDCTVRNNVFLDIDSAAMAAWCAKGARFQNNTAVNVATRDRAAIIVLQNHNLPSTDLEFVNNVVVGSKQGNRPLVWIYAQGADGRIVFENNCWSGGNGKFWNQAAGAGPVDFAQWQSASGTDKTSLFADPKLDKDHHLLEGSPCIDRAQAIQAFADDYDGGRRSGRWDIGADEFKSGTSLAVPPAQGTVGTGPTGTPGARR